MKGAAAGGKSQIEFHSLLEGGNYTVTKYRNPQVIFLPSRCQRAAARHTHRGRTDDEKKGKKNDLRLCQKKSRQTSVT